MTVTKLRAPTIEIDPPRGLAYALGAYVIWGCLPLYLKLMQARFSAGRAEPGI